METLSREIVALYNRLGSDVLDEYARIHGISKKLSNWRGNLMMIHAVMGSVERRHLLYNPEVHDCLAKLLHATSQIERLLNQFAVDAKEEAMKSGTRSAELPPCPMVRFSKRNQRTLLSDHHIMAEIKDIDNILDEVFRLICLLSSVMIPLSWPSTTPSPSVPLRQPKFFGREKEMKQLLSQLIGSDEEDDGLHPYNVVSIVGVGGIGKTALAQELFSHESVLEEFEHRSWAFVPEAFNPVDIVKNILESIAPTLPCHERGLIWLLDRLEERVSGKKLLIALDNVRNKNHIKLEGLFKAAFHSVRRGSRILITSRSHGVCEWLGDRDPTSLGFLSFNECLSLLVYQSIGRESFESQPHLRGVAESLAEKCGGLPLAARTLGGLLGMETHYKTLKYMLEHDLLEESG